MSQYRIFVSGPYTQGDVAQNVHRAIAAGHRLINAGFAPFIPHLYHFAHMQESQHYRTWMVIDKNFLSTCHAVLRVPGPSDGANEECDFARSMGKPVFVCVADLVSYFDSLYKKYDRIYANT